MKKILLPACLFCTLNLSAQMVNETVTFDTYVSASDNDFENRFDGGTGLTQITFNGISGGCLQTPQTISWGNDNAVYCTRFKGITGTTYTTGISFKYDTSQLNNINFDRAASLWMKPYADPNHYVIASILDTRRIQIVSYSATGSSNPLALQSGHWYNLLLSTVFTGGGAGDQIDINAQVNDLGITGNDPPIPTGFTNATLHDSILIADTAIDVSITGTLWGGALYLDNFSFSGMKSFDNCISTGLSELSNEQIQVFQHEKKLTVISEIGSGSISIYNIQGKEILSQKITSSETVLSTSEFSPGIYLLKIQSGKKQFTKKLFLIS